MPNTLKINGLAELRAELRALPEHLAQEAAGIVLSHGESAAARIRAGYPVKTGELRKGVKVEKINAGRFGAAVRVKNVARLAYIYEHGTEAVRHWAGGKSTGKMPPSHLFVRELVRERRAMTDDLIALVERQGLKVTR